MLTIERQRSAAFCALLGLSLAAGVGAEIAAGCGGCERIADRFAFSHSRSLDIALATKSAIENGVISRSPVMQGELVSYRPKRLEQIPTSKLAEAWLVQQEFRVATEPLSIDVLCIDAHEVYSAEVRRGLLLPQRQWVSKADLTLVTTKTLLAALLNKEIELTDAEGLGLVSFEGQRPGFSLPLVTKSDATGDGN
jgi:hypothetical protein